MPPAKPKSERSLRAELKRVKARLAESEATLKAIQSGDIDAVIVDGPGGSRIFTLQSPEDPYRTMAERMNEGAATLSAEGTLLFCNRRLAEMVELSPERLLGSSFPLLLREQDRPAVAALLRSAAKKDIRADSYLLRQDGTTLPVQLSLSSIPLEESGQGLCLVATDLCEQKRAQEALRESEERLRKLNEDLEERIAKRTAQLAEANQELEAFNYSVSHDLRAPLRHIAGFSGILISDFAPTMSVEAREHLQHIQAAVVRMGLLVDGLLSLAKLGRQSLKLCRTELNDVVEQVISILQPECEGRQVEWQIARLPALDCDPILMAQVFQNLLGNALKYSRGRARAIIEMDSIRRPGKPAIIFVRDNGVGFNMRYAERLFGVFQRLHTDSEFEGTGVGLATVRRIIQKHGGTIWAESEPDHGATFYFALQMTEQIGTTPKATAASTG
jgi:PAS domain S-box-containing protein